MTLFRLSECYLVKTWAAKQPQKVSTSDTDKVRRSGWWCKWFSLTLRSPRNSPVRGPCSNPKWRAKPCMAGTSRGHTSTASWTSLPCSGSQYVGWRTLKCLISPTFSKRLSKSARTLVCNSSMTLIISSNVVDCKRSLNSCSPTTYLPMRRLGSLTTWIWLQKPPKIDSSAVKHKLSLSQP